MRTTILTADDWRRIANGETAGMLTTSHDLHAKLAEYARRELARQEKAGRTGGRPRKEEK